jgi:hypothetical protein
MTIIRLISKEQRKEETPLAMVKVDKGTGVTTARQ